ncbi:unnamed protein product [Lota lota]
MAATCVQGNELCDEPCKKGRDVKEASTQSDSKLQGHVPRLSRVNLFTLLSLWMERFPRESPDNPDDHPDDHPAVRGSGLVVVREGKVLGLHSSGPELHAGQVAVIRQGGAGLLGSQLYFSRRPCATCLKMVVNAGVSHIFFWPGDPEVSMLRPAAPGSAPDRAPGLSPKAPGLSPEAPGLSPEARLDLVATEKLKANSRAPVCVALRPLAPGMAQYVEQKSRTGDFMERVQEDEEDFSDVFSRRRRTHLQELSQEFLIASEQQHRAMLTHMGLENFCEDPYLSSLRHNMVELVEVLATISAGLPLLNHGFYSPGNGSAARGPQPPAVSQDVACHCMIQATLLAYRTEDPKVGVGAVIWAEGESDGCDGTGRLDLVGCGYNAYPVGSQYAQYPQMDTKHVDRHSTKYRYIIHAEQNALTFRSREIRAGQRTLLFVTKCPCDECVPLIRAAGITHIYTTDQDCGKDKGEISYLRFGGLQGISKLIWQKCPPVSPTLTNGCGGKRQRRGSHSDQERHDDKRLCCPDMTPDLSSPLPPVC